MLEVAGDLRRAPAKFENPATKYIKSWSKGNIPFGGCSMVHSMHIILIGQHILPPVKKERIPFRSIFLEMEMNPATIVITSKYDGY